MITYIGSENIISPLGSSASDNFEKIKEGHSGIRLFQSVGHENSDVHLSKIKTLEGKNKFDQLLVTCLSALCDQTTKGLIRKEETLVIISTTKGDIEENLDSPLLGSVNTIREKFQLKNTPLIISSACISGVLAMNTANNLIKSGAYKHVFVVGADIITDFVLFGFQSLYAIDEVPCKPFDKERKGITLGEGAGGVVMSCDNSIYKTLCFEFVEGTSSNDANHISGPSRDGEGLYRTVKNTMESSGVAKDEIDHISAHGTGTLFNDEMESIAFHRLGMDSQPLNSLKGYFGHTLGAAGLIETAICLQSLRKGILIKSLGFESPGTSKPLNLITENDQKDIKTILKTASGFGGCNASAIIRSL